MFSFCSLEKKHCNMSLNIIKESHVCPLITHWQYTTAVKRQPRKEGKKIPQTSHLTLIRKENSPQMYKDEVFCRSKYYRT